MVVVVRKIFSQINKELYPLKICSDGKDFLYKPVSSSSIEVYRQRLNDHF